MSRSVHAWIAGIALRSVNTVRFLLPLAIFGVQSNEMLIFILSAHPPCRNQYARWICIWILVDVQLLSWSHVMILPVSIDWHDHNNLKCFAELALISQHFQYFSKAICALCIALHACFMRSFNMINALECCVNGCSQKFCVFVCYLLAVRQLLQSVHIAITFHVEIRFSYDFEPYGAWQTHARAHYFYYVFCGYVNTARLHFLQR